MTTTMSAAGMQTAALNQFGRSTYGGRGTHAQQRRAERERKAITDTASAFHSVVTSDNPPQSRDEAIRSTVGTLGWVLSFLFPQYAIAIKVAAFLWDLWQQSRGT